MTLPRPMPSKKTRSISVNAYVDPPTIMTSTRVQAISSRREANAVSANRTSASVRRWSAVGGAGGAGGAGGVPEALSCLASEIADAPIVRLVAAVGQRDTGQPTD